MNLDGGKRKALSLLSVNYDVSIIEKIRFYQYLGHASMERSFRVPSALF